MKQYLIRPAPGMTGIHVGAEAVRFTDGEPEWVGVQLAIALLGRGASNEGEREAEDAPEPPAEMPPEAEQEQVPDQIPATQSNDMTPDQPKTQSDKSFAAALRQIVKGKKSKG